MIGVVVLTYRPAPGMLEGCLASVRSHTVTPDGEPVHVMVVDNGGVCAALRAADPDAADAADALRDVDVLAQTTNTGFAGGMNAGFRRGLELGCRVVVILNDDATVEPGWLPPLLTELSVEGVGAVQPKLLFTGEPPVVNSLGVRLGADGAGTDIGRDQPDDGAVEPSDLHLFTGGAVAFSDAFLRATGGFDERYFMYYEDVDLALRGHELGWRYRLAPASRVRHRGSATASTVGDVVVFHRERNRLWVLFRHRPWADVLRGVWLSVRRLRWVPRGTHAHALLAGLAAAPRLVTTRVRGSAAPVNRL
ncbi:MAG: glycosyltransferase family 2 protein [Acidimicrobiales bacterium]|nr:glycosyltransferase family 2 protein [Acidimicrobiales bacterium]MCB9394884.1 glycosyltransferase family 2 protein [Acidimicrobiaceae bacterium]